MCTRYSWATYTTVGYGDIGFATLPSVTLFTWAVQYSFFVIGAILLDTLISCAYTLLLVDEEDEDEGGLKKSISKLVDVESVSEDSQSQNDDTSASPLVEVNAHHTLSSSANQLLCRKWMTSKMLVSS